MPYQYYATFDNLGPDRVTVAHSCGHPVVYHYGGTHPDFEQPRRDFAAEHAGRPCPECALLDKLAAPPPPLPHDVPVVSATCGRGLLTARSGKVVLLLDEPVILEQYDSVRASKPPHPQGYFNGVDRYAYVARLIGPGACDASYLHRDEQHAYTLEELAWLDEYRIAGLMARDGYERYYSYGRTLSNAYQFAEVERRTGRPVYLNNDDIDHDAESREEAEMSRQESALELACEAGILPGAAPADI